MAVQHSVIRGICAGRRYFSWESHSDATARARLKDGRLKGRPRGVRNERPSSVTVCHPSIGAFPCGFRREDQAEESLMILLTPVALCVPSTPADMGDATDASFESAALTSSCLVPLGGWLVAIPTFL